MRRQVGVFTMKPVVLFPSVFVFSLAFVMPLTGPVQAQQNELQKAVAAADVQAGKRYALRCKACHTLDKGGANRLGPNLWEIVGRKQTSVKKFKYSPAFKKLTGVWNVQELDAFLTNPRKYARGNRMAFAGIKQKKRRHQLLAYLASLSDKTPKTKAPVKRTAVAKGGPSLADELKLATGNGREEVAALCSACHSLAIVRQQGLDRDRWDELMTWMTKKQGMPELKGKERTLVVQYLAKNFGPQSRKSRPSVMNPMMPRLSTMPLPTPK